MHNYVQAKNIHSIIGSILTIITKKIYCENRLNKFMFFIFKKKCALTLSYNFIYIYHNTIIIKDSNEC